MQNTKNSGKKLMLKGIFLVLWGELKTMNREKLSGLAKILSGYVRMKFQAPKKTLPPPERRVRTEPRKEEVPLTY